MANIQVASPPSAVMKVQNRPTMLRTYVQTSGGSPRPESGQMYPRTK